MVPKVSPHMENLILRYWTQGFSKSFIAKHTHLSRPTIYRIIREWEAGPGKDFARKPRKDK